MKAILNEAQINELTTLIGELLKEKRVLERLTPVEFEIDNTVVTGYGNDCWGRIPDMDIPDGYHRYSVLHDGNGDPAGIFPETHRVNHAFDFISKNDYTSLIESHGGYLDITDADWGFTEREPNGTDWAVTVEESSNNTDGNPLLESPQAIQPTELSTEVIGYITAYWQDCADGHPYLASGNDDIATRDMALDYMGERFDGYWEDDLSARPEYVSKLIAQSPLPTNTNESEAEQCWDAFRFMFYKLWPKH